MMLEVENVASNLEVAQGDEVSSSLGMIRQVY